MATPQRFEITFFDPDPYSLGSNLLYREHLDTEGSIWT